eukprot:746267-Hanusia_phi.AAC.2
MQEGARLRTENDRGGREEKGREGEGNGENAYSTRTAAVLHEACGSFNPFLQQADLTHRSTSNTPSRLLPALSADLPPCLHLSPSLTLPQPPPPSPPSSHGSWRRNGLRCPSCKSRSC